MKSAISMLLLMAILLIGCVQVVNDKQGNASKEPAANAETKEPAKQPDASKTTVAQPKQSATKTSEPSEATEELPPALPE